MYKDTLMPTNFFFLNSGMYFSTLKDVKQENLVDQFFLF